MPDFKPSRYHTEGKLHVAIHGKLSQFNSRNTDNPIVLDYIRSIDPSKSRLRDIMINDINSMNQMNIIPPSFKSIMHDNTIMWCGLIESMVFNDKLFNLFYSEYSGVLDRVVNTTIDTGDSIIYREYKTGFSIFHTAAKLRLISRLMCDADKTIGQKITGLDAELTYILKCYRELGKVFNDGNELLINYIEDFSGTYLIDYITAYVDEVVNSSLF